jgi:hypothetical protein
VDFWHVYAQILHKPVFQLFNSEVFGIKSLHGKCFWVLCLELL